ncbi:MAG: putative hydrolase or acyltransferase of alpha/beta superfamily, partial [Microbacteriaceae bacterium]|nr:putative hydrolase or acyltransferase of alpha/beta superfamily [Microbacteriaceae bacterium]
TGDAVHLVGHSVGGAVAGLAAAEAPDLWASVSVVASPPMGVPVFADRAAEARSLGMAAIVPGTLARWFAMDGGAAELSALAYVNTCLAALPVETWAALWSSFAQFSGFAPLPAGTRTMCVAGAIDSSTPPGALQAIYDVIGGDQRSEGVQVIAGAAHQLVLTHPGVLGELLLDGTLAS